MDDTNECQYILVHKIHLQLKLYHCNVLLSTYIQQNNQKVEKNKTNLPIRLLFRLVTSVSPFMMRFSKPRISKWDFPDTTVPNSISDWEVWYFRNSDDPRTLHKTMAHSHENCPQPLGWWDCCLPFFVLAAAS